MRVLFVYPNITGHESIHQGLISVSSYIKKHGHTTGLIDFTFYETYYTHLKKAIKFEPDIICFTASSGMVPASLEFASLLKEHLSVPILFGGVHATIAPETLIRKDPVDLVCVSEGEEPLQELLERMASGNEYVEVKNLWVKKNGRVYKNPVRPLMPDLDLLPFPDFELFDLERYLEARKGHLDLITGRGCPYQCTYCVNHRVQKIQNQYGKNFMRKHSVQYLMKMISRLLSNYSVKFIDFQDDLFVIYKHWIIDFSENFKKLFPDTHFGCNCRPEMAEETIFKKLKEAGCKKVNMGIESGDEYIRKNVLRRKMSDKMIINAFRLAKEAGLNTNSYNMLGLPFETKEQRYKTVSLNRIIQPSKSGISIFTPYPGTDLYDLCLKEGLIEPDHDVPSQHRSFVTLNYDSKTKREIKWLKRFFRFQVYKNIPKKAIYFLLYDNFYDLFIKYRSNIPENIKKYLIKIHYVVAKQE